MIFKKYNKIIIFFFLLFANFFINAQCLIPIKQNNVDYLVNKPTDYVHWKIGCSSFEGSIENNGELNSGVFHYSCSLVPRFEGTFINNLPYEGKFYFLNGDVFEGTFEDGCLPKCGDDDISECGKLYFYGSDSSIYQGKVELIPNDDNTFFIDAIPQGRGIITDKNGKTKEGIWENGIFQEDKKEITIQWLSHNVNRDSITFEDEEFNLKLKIKYPSTDCKDYQWLVNGQAIRSGDFEEEDIVNGEQIVSKKFSFQGKGLYKISLLATCDSLTKESKILNVYYRVPKLFIVSIGAKYSNLTFPAIDATDMGELFNGQDKLFFPSPKGFPKLLLNNRAETQVIRREINALNNLQQNAEIKANDFVMVYFSGHGEVIGENYALKPADYDKTMPEATSVKLDEIIGWMNKLTCNKILIIDACYSGEVISSRNTNNWEIPNQENNWLIITASDNLAFEPTNNQGKNGILTGVIKEGLQGKKADGNADNNITVKELAKFIKRRVPEINNAQTPKTFYTKQMKNVVLYKY